MRKLIKYIIIAILIMAAASWLTTVAYGHTPDSIVQLNGTSQTGILVVAAPLAAAPAAAFYGHAIGSVTAGDLFYIDSTNVTQDITVNLYITNTDELVPYFKYMTLEVAVYFEAAPGQWEKALMIDGSAFPATFLTMRNGLVTFNMPGLVNYKVTIDSGCFNCHRAVPAGENIAPRFYLEAE